MNPGEVAIREQAVRVPCGNAWLDGDLVLPENALGLVMFAHGSGSSRRSPRNRQVARRMQDAGLGTLLFDLLTAEEAYAEERGAMRRFDIPFLADRLAKVTKWVRAEPKLHALGIGYFGASTGAAAALVAAARDPAIRAVVSRGGRTDLAGDLVGYVSAPVLLIVGSLDLPVLEWNRETLERLGGVRKLSVVQGASHLFEEYGTLEEVADLAADWFALHLPGKTTQVT